MKSSNEWLLLNYPIVFWNLWLILGDLKCFVGSSASSLRILNLTEYIGMFFCEGDLGVGLH